MTDHKSKSAPRDALNYNRRDVLRRAGYLGVGAIGFGIVGCKQRPDEDLVDLATEPQVLQQGGTVSLRASGLLTGAAASEVTLRILGLGSVTSNAQGAADVRVEQNGEYDVEITSDDHFRRSGRIRVTGNVTLDVPLLERSAGISREYIDEYARGLGKGKGITIQPRTPGRTNRWNSPPTFRLYRQLEDSNKEFVSDTRLDAMRASILGLFPALTANRLGVPSIEVRNAAPAALGEVPAGTEVVAQRVAPRLSHESVGSIQSVFVLSRAHIGCPHDSTIEIFNRMVAHASGAYGVSSGTGSIVSGPGAAGLSDRDQQAATFLYSRVAGNRAPDTDPDGVFLN